MELLNKVFGRITKEKFKHHFKTRLVYYILAILIFLIGGAKALAMTTLLILSFFLGWITCKLINAFKDWRLTQRLNRIHFTAVEFDSLKRERDLAIEAFKSVSKESLQTKRTSESERTRSVGGRSVRFTQEDIKEFIAQNGGLDND